MSDKLTALDLRRVVQQSPYLHTALLQPWLELSRDLVGYSGRQTVFDIQNIMRTSLASILSKFCRARDPRQEPLERRAHSCW